METLIQSNASIETQQALDFGLVSIIMPNYNSESYLKETIDTVLAQSYQNWELIIVDDCSTDKSVEIIEQYKDERIRLIHNVENCGAARSRNRAIEAANGRWIAFLDSDDLWAPSKLSEQLAFMTEQDCAFSFTHYYFDRNEGELKEFSPEKDVYDYNAILKHCYIACPTVIYDSSVLGKVYMPPEAEKREDFGCWLSILRRDVKAFCLHRSLTTVKIHAGSVSYNKLKMVKHQWHVYRCVEKLSFVKSAYYMIHWAIKGFFKYRK